MSTMEQNRVLITYAIFYNPLDYPGKYVVRAFNVGPNNDFEPIPYEKPLYVGDDLLKARGVVPRGKYRIPKSPQDHESVVETWV